MMLPPLFHLGILEKHFDRTPYVYGIPLVKSISCVLQHTFMYVLLFIPLYTIRPLHLDAHRKLPDVLLFGLLPYGMWKGEVPKLIFTSLQCHTIISSLNKSGGWVKAFAVVRTPQEQVLCIHTGEEYYSLWQIKQPFLSVSHRVLL